MQIRKGLNSDLARLEYCDFSFTVSQIATGPFVNNDLKIETLPSAYNKTYELDIQTLENHCVNPDAIFLIAETDAGQVAGFITASLIWNKFISVDYIAIERSQRRTARPTSFMAAAHSGLGHERGGIKAGNPERQRSRLSFLPKLWLYPGRIRSLSLQRVTGKR